MTSNEPGPVRAILVGIPERLRDRLLTGIRDSVVCPDLYTAGIARDANAFVAIVYGEEMFGPAVTGQDVFLGQPWTAGGTDPRVVVLIDHSPRKLDELDWDDPRRLSVNAGVRLAASYLIDVSEMGAIEAFDELVDDIILEARAHARVVADDGTRVTLDEAERELGEPDVAQPPE